MRIHNVPLFFLRVPSAVLLLLLGLAATAWAGSPTTVLISQALGGGPALTLANSSSPALSADGSLVAFLSNALDLASGGNGHTQVMFQNRSTGSFEIISQSTGGTVGDGDSGAFAMSADGRYVTFASSADNLVANDTNLTSDVFIRDRTSGTTTRINVGPGGAQANYFSGDAVAISSDGRYIVYDSTANNLVAGITSFEQTYLYDSQTGLTEDESVSSAGVPAVSTLGFLGVSVSADGQSIAFVSGDPNLVSGAPAVVVYGQVFVRNRSSQTTQLGSILPTGTISGFGSEHPQLSADGTQLLFNSQTQASTSPLVPNELYLRNLTTGTTTVVGILPNGSTDNSASNGSMSPDGLFVAFVDGNVYVRDLTGNTTELSRVWKVFPHARLLVQAQQDEWSAEGLLRTYLVSVPLAGTTSNGQTPPTSQPSVASGGRFVAFDSTANNLVTGDTNLYSDIFLRDRQLESTTRISLTAAEAQPLSGAHSTQGSMSPDGRYVAFSSDAINLVAGIVTNQFQVYLADTVTGVIELESLLPSGTPGNGTSGFPSISGDARYIAFTSDALNLAGPNSNTTGNNVFVRDRSTGALENESLPYNGAAGGGGGQVSMAASLSHDGRFVAFISNSTDLIPADTGKTFQLFVRDRATGAIEQDSLGPVGSQNGDPDGVSISGDGRYVAFILVQSVSIGNPYQMGDAFLYDRFTGVTEQEDVATDGTFPNSNAIDVSVNGDGSAVAFTSGASNLLPNTRIFGPNVFVRDRIQATTTDVSVSSTGALVAGGGFGAVLSSDGKCISFTSESPDLVPGDTNNSVDGFLHDRTLGTTERITLTNTGMQSAGFSDLLAYNPILSTLSGDGGFAEFTSAAGDIVPGDNDGGLDVFLRDRAPGTATAAPASPTGLTATVVPPAAIRLNWVSHSNNETGFRVERSVGSGPLEPAGTVGARVTTFTDLNLTPNTTYTYFVYAFNAVGACGTAGPAVIDPIGNPPAAPTNLTASLAPGPTVNLQWIRNSTNETGFVVQRSSGGEPFTTIGSPPAGSTSYTDAGVTAGESYQYQVAAVNASGPSAFAGPVSVTVPLPAPGNLTASLASGPTVNLQWIRNSTNETGFEVQRSEGGAFATIGTAPAGSTSYADTGVSPGIQYQYQVAALNGSGVSAFAGPVSVTVPALPATPFGLSAVEPSAGEIALQWNTDEGGVDGLVIERGVDGTSFGPLATVPASTTSYTDTGLSPNAIYYYRIHAYNIAGSSPESGSLSALTLPRTPGNFQATAATNTSVHLSWTLPVGSAQSFAIQRGVGGRFTAIGTVPAGDTTYDDTVLASDTAYAYRIESVNASGVSGWITASATTFGNPAGTLHVPGSVQFGKVAVGNTATRTLTIANSSKTAALSVTVAGLPLAPFQVTGGSGPFWIPPEASVTMQLSFTPAKRKQAAGKLKLTSSDRGQRAAVVELSGTGK